jgi:HEAT repeat protein
VVQAQGKIMRTLSVPLGLLVLGVASGPACAQTPAQDEKLLRAAGIDPAGPALVELFRKQVPNAVDRQRVAGLVRLLSEANFKVRLKASNDLIALGPAVIPLLRQAQANADLETTQRLKQCIDSIQRGNEATKLVAAARLLARHRPAGAAPALLAFVPFAEHGPLEAAVWQALAALQADDARLALPALVEALRDPHPPNRTRAARGLAYLGWEAQPAVKALAQALGDTDGGVRRQALAALERLGPFAAEAVPALLPLVQDKDAGAREAAWKVLGQLGPHAKAALPAMRDRLVSADARETYQAARLLGAMGPDAIPALLTVLDKGQPTARQWALHALGQIGCGDPDVLARFTAALDDPATHAWAATNLPRLGPAALPVLRKALNHRDAGVRAQAADALGRFGPYARPAVENLRARLRDEDAEVRALAALALWAVDRRAEGLVGPLADGVPLGRNLSPVRSLAVLGSLYPRPREAEAVLLKTLRHGHPLARRNAVWAVAKHPADRAAVVRALLDMSFKEKEVFVRQEVLLALAGVAPESEQVLLVLAKALGDKNPALRRTALHALGKLGANIGPVLPAVQRLLKDPALQFEAAHLLARLGPAAAPAVPDLIEAAPRSPVAIQALGQIGPEAREAIPVLVQQLGNPHLSQKAMEALARIGPDAIPALVAAVEARKPPQAAVLAAQTLGRLGPKAVGPLLRVLQTGQRFEAAFGLGELGPQARAAVSPLVTALKEGDPGTRRGAAWALGQIGVSTPEVVAALTGALTDRECRAPAARSLAALKARTAAEPLAGALDDADRYFRLVAAEALAQVDPSSPRPPALLRQALKDASPVTRREAVRIIQRLGYRDGATLTALRPLLDDEEAAVRQEVLACLTGLAQKEDGALPSLVALLGHPDLNLRKKAMEALAGVGPRAHPAVPALTRMLRHRAPDLRLQAVKTLAALGPAAKPALPELLFLLEASDGPDKVQVAEAVCRAGGPADRVLLLLIENVQNHGDPDRQQQAARLLIDLGAKAKPALVRLVTLARVAGATPGYAAGLRPYAAWALWRLDGQSREAAHALVQALAESDPKSRQRALLLLGEMGREARLAIPAVRVALRDPEDSVRAAAREALQKME